MDAILSRLPTTDSLRDWASRNSAKIGGFAAGSIGMWITTMFLVVAITGIPYGGERLDPNRTVVYPNF